MRIPDWDPFFFAHVLEIPSCRQAVGVWGQTCAPTYVIVYTKFRNKVLTLRGLPLRSTMETSSGYLPAAVTAFGGKA